MNKSKRGQLTIFIIIAILIIAIVLGFYLFSNDRSSGIPRSFEPIYNNFLTCLEQDLQMGILALETQGGYIDLPEYEPGTLAFPFSSYLNFVGTSIPYWYYVSGGGVQKTQVPSAQDMEIELEEFILSRVKSCEFDSYYEEEFTLFLEENPKAGVIIKDNEVVLDLDMDFVAYHENERVLVKNHKVSVNSMLGSLYKDALKVYGYEQEEFFLEKYGLDVLNLYAPVDGVEFTCSPKIWIADNIFNDLEEAIEVNTMALKTGNDDDYFSVNVETENNVRFFNSRNWPRNYEVNPTDGNVMRADPVGNQPGLGILGFCYVTYHFVYNMNYPVLVQIYSEDSNEIFQFPLGVVIRGNKEREPLSGSALAFDKLELCEDMVSPARVNVYDSNGNVIEANISFSCLGQKCNIGETIAGTLDGYFPQCVNGFIHARSNGYEEGKLLYSSVRPGQVSIFLDKMYEREIRLNVDGKRYSGDALINFISDDLSKTISYPLQTEVEISEGDYEVYVYVYADSSLKLPETTREQCVDVPRGFLGGIFGLTKKQCFELKISEQVVDNALSAGGRAEYSITESQLSGSKIIQINVESLPKPDSLEQLQENYILFEDKIAEVTFR